MKGHKTEAGSGVVDNLASLHTLDEDSLLDEIRIRYHSDIIYTYIGDILLAVNPYKRILIYGNDHLNRYSDIKIRAELPPHLFAISDAAYQAMRRSGVSQCCVVSGESGSGKTESTKLMVQHIAHLCKHVNGHLHDRIIQVNPLLEAFGNAQTMMNNNSSRFGKYIELSFAHDGRIMGARISEYLLEKSRVVSQGPGEKNFHVFYYIFAGLTSEQLKINLLNMPEDHRILRNLDGHPIFTNESEFNYYRELWDRLREIMDTVGFLPEEINMILALLASILHITDIEFSEDYDTDGVYIIREDVMEIAAELLAVQPEELAAAFISNVTFLRGEKIMSLKNKDQANDGRDALAKSLYGRLFGWIVRQINMMLQPDHRSASIGPSIGILDIAGFENFENNSFEQLCINAANEQLQFYFNQHIFQWELDEYKKEGVKGKDIKFVNNRPVIDMLLESPLGLFSLLDEESRFPQSSDITLVEKLNKNLGKKGHFQRPKSQQSKFNISHYAGTVQYNVNGFLEKNRDTLSANLLECMKNSESQIVCDLFTAPISDTGALQLNPDGPKRSRKSVLLCKPKDWSYTKTRSLSKKAGRKLKEQKAKKQIPIYENTLRSTMGGHFKNSLTDLMSKLLDCDPHFVRCIKPNNQKKSGQFEPKMVSDQLKYTGVLETVRIRRLGYATRIPFHIFVDRYQMLTFPMTQKVEGTAQNCSKILKKLGLKEWEIGKTKVFLKYWHVEQLTLLLDKLGWDIVHCQKYIRGFLDRKKYKKMHELSGQDKAAVRGFCVYIANQSEDLFFNLCRQQEHDKEKQRKKLEEQEHATYARIDQIQQIYESKQALERERVAQRALSPVRKEDRPLPPTPRDRSPSPNQDRIKNIFKPTPILLGNPVYGGHDQIQRNVNDTYAAGGLFRPGFRRQKSETKSKSNKDLDDVASVSPIKSHFEASENEHLTRMSPVPTTTPKDSKEFYDRMINETIQRLPTVETENWAKLHYNERNQVVVKLYLREKEVIIDNSDQQYDGHVIGLKAYENVYRDSKIDKVRNSIGKGLKLSTDTEGNIYATKLTKGDIIVKGYMDPTQHCLSAEVVEGRGRLTEKPMKVFDMREYKMRVSNELRKPSIDADLLHRLAMVSFSFIRNTFDDLETPCWVTVINFTALNQLGQDEMLREVQSLARLNLRDAEQVQMRRNWQKLDLRNPYGSTPNLNNNNTPAGRLSRADYAKFGESTYHTSAAAKRNWAKFNVRGQDT